MILLIKILNQTIILPLNKKLEFLPHKLPTRNLLNLFKLSRRLPLNSVKLIMKIKLAKFVNWKRCKLIFNNNFKTCKKLFLINFNIFNRRIRVLNSNNSNINRQNLKLLFKMFLTKDKNKLSFNKMLPILTIMPWRQLSLKENHNSTKIFYKIKSFQTYKIIKSMKSLNGVQDPRFNRICQILKWVEIKWWDKFTHAFKGCKPK